MKLNEPGRPEEDRGIPAADKTSKAFFCFFFSFFSLFVKSYVFSSNPGLKEKAFKSSGFFSTWSYSQHRWHYFIFCVRGTPKRRAERGERPDGTIITCFPCAFSADQTKDIFRHVLVERGRWRCSRIPVSKTTLRSYQQAHSKQKYITGNLITVENERDTETQKERQRQKGWTM